MPSPELGGEYEAARVHHASRRYGRCVAVCGALPTLAARPATSMIPIVFEVGDHPIKAGVSLANRWLGRQCGRCFCIKSGSPSAPRIWAFEKSINTIFHVSSGFICGIPDKYC